MGNPEADRIHSMDALRASTMFLLVPVHAAALLALNGHPGGWSVAIFWLVHVFRLPLFFAMSGFFLVFLVSRKGLGQTLRNRTLRIAVPLAVGLVTVVPLFYLVSEAPGLTVTSGDGQSGEGSQFGFQLSYLWFLWYLLILDAIAIVAYLAAPRVLSAAGHGLRWALSRPVRGLVLLAIPTAAILLAQPEWAGLPASTDSYLPEPSVLAYNAIFFALGACLCAHRELVAAARDRAWAWAGCAVAATLVAAILFSAHNSALGDRPYVRAAIVAADAVATLTCLFALIGLANLYLDRRRPRLRYLADSSYWIYLSHMPVVVLLIALLAGAPLGTAPAFVLVTAGAIGASLATYPVLVRYTAIGRVLNGPRRRPSREVALVPAEQSGH